VGLGNCDRYSPAVAGKHPLREVLPDTVVPIHYDLALSPDADALIFQGKVAILLWRCVWRARLSCPEYLV
jgi:hypothetical protein